MTLPWHAHSNISIHNLKRCHLDPIYEPKLPSFLEGGNGILHKKTPWAEQSSSGVRVIIPGNHLQKCLLWGIEDMS